MKRDAWLRVLFMRRGARDLGHPIYKENRGVMGDASSISLLEPYGPDKRAAILDVIDAGTDTLALPGRMTFLLSAADLAEFTAACTLYHFIELNM